jgi:hypothetical protein
MILVNEKLGFLFFDTPLSIQGIRRSLKRYVPGTTELPFSSTVPLRYVDLLYNPLYNNLIESCNKLTFGVIRNPFDYMIAMYEYFINGSTEAVSWHGKIALEKDALREQMRLASRGFDNFVLNDKDYQYLHSRPFCGNKFTQQTMWLHGVQKVYKFDDITPLLNDLFKIGGGTLPAYMDGDVPPAQDLASKRKRYYTNPLVVDMITKMFPEDFRIGEFSQSV